MTSHAGEPIDLDRLLDAVYEASEFLEADYLKHRRTEPLASWRRVAMYLVREHTDLSYPAIGRLFHRDHSTVFAAVRSVRAAVLDAGHVLDLCESVYAILEGGITGVDET